jgi:hypothetical protein
MTTAVRTTGADAQPEELRRRNVASQQDAAPVVAEAPAKEKSKEKVKSSSTHNAAAGRFQSNDMATNHTAAVRHYHLPR